MSTKVSSVSKLRVYIERLINLVSVRTDSTGKPFIYFSKPLVLPPSEDSAEEKYRESVMIVSRWIDEIIESGEQVDSSDTLRKLLIKKLRESVWYYM